MSISEGREIAESDMRRRMQDSDRGGTPAGPEYYLVSAQGIDCDCRVAKKISLKEATRTSHELARMRNHSPCE